MKLEQDGSVADLEKLRAETSKLEAARTKLLAASV